MHPQAAEGDRKLETYLEVVLRQLGVATEGTDSGVAEQGSEAAAGHIQCQAHMWECAVKIPHIRQMPLPKGMLLESNPLHNSHPPPTWEGGA